ncbi:Poly-beta-1,6-N-acetyl-D-glucosamine N-deacetylase [Tepidimonas thermarum]|uniref:Poly-beta-1,6-N-acetyl-D-glucosamine N-deacetylase n=1 Tax=Tepidimonas thermarum TaxID=335431 RepID=A0A554X4Y2_9BURK|nr:polysaccharide deacetylase family protein [Tepidimonas thermarum]TSE30891.1 Poly-beta-1,6-N-acetyl-D-glucosamine N-deacetylase [Tepidimonas thermarum]
MTMAKTRAAHGFDILMYHQVGEFEPMREHRATYCHVARFRAQMAWLARWGYRVCSLADACARWSTGQLDRRTVVLTFDDGYENFYQYAWPILQQHGWTATVYLIAGSIGATAHWLAQAGHPAARLMDWPRIRALQREGVHFGSHAWHHQRLAGRPWEAQWQELRDSRHALEDGLGVSVHDVCYPYGSYDATTLAVAAETGYTRGVTCVRARVAPGWDPLALPRKAVSYGDSALGMGWKLAFKNTPKHEVVMRPGFGVEVA